jgi:predicted Zn-dependent protease with MMP-like domain
MEFPRLTAIAIDAVGAAQRRLPPEIRPVAKQVPVHYEPKDGDDPELLGVFTGSAHGVEFDQADLAPPQIVLFLETLWEDAAGDLDIFREQVAITYLHELGHYLGWDEDQLTARGLE